MWEVSGANVLKIELVSKMYLNGAQRFSLVHSVSFFIVSDNMTGSHSLYTIYEGHEIMFHVSTMLPFTPDNPQQVTNMCSTLLLH